MAEKRTAHPQTTNVENPTLEPQHIQYLVDRAVEPEWVEQAYNGTCRYRSVQQGDKGLRLFTSQHKLPGLLICLPGLDGQTYYQLRPDNPPEGRKFLFPADTASPIDRGPHSIDQIRQAADILVVEGHVKADAARQAAPEKTPTLSIAGCDCAFEKDTQRQQLKPELLDMEWEDKNLFLIFDADTETNTQVAQAQKELGKRFQELGANIYDVNVPVVQGDEHTGIDDWLAKQQDPATAFAFLLGNTKKRRAPSQAKKTADEKKAKAAAEESRKQGQDWGERIQLEYTDRRCALAVLEGKESDNGPRIRHPLAGELFVSKTLGRFYLWTGTYFANVAAGQVEEEISLRLDELSDTIPPAPENLGEEGQKQAEKAIQKIRQTLESVNKRSAVKARTATNVKTQIDEKDIATPDHLVPLPNGKCVDLENMKLVDSKPNMRIFATLGVVPDKNMETPHWNQFKEQISTHDWWIAQAVESVAGLITQGKRDKQALYGMVGVARSGKTLIMNVLRHILGDFVALAARGTFFEDGKKGDRHDQHYETHIGKRLIACEDPSGKPQETTLLQYSGRVPMHAERKGGEMIQFMPTGTILITGQEDRLKINGIDLALQARLRIIPFNVSFAGKEDEELERNLIKEAPGIAAQILQHASQYYQTGMLLHEERMRQEANKWASEMDVVGRFLDEKCFADNQKTTPSSVLYKAYQDWAEGQGEYIQSQRWFTAQLKQPRDEWQIEQVRTANVRGFKGVTMEEND